jgi:hypothetical protein
MARTTESSTPPAHESLRARLSHRFRPTHDEHDGGDSHDDMRRAEDEEPNPTSTFDKLISIAYRSGQGGM